MIRRLLKRAALALTFLGGLGSIGAAVWCIMSLCEKLGRYGYLLPWAVGTLAYAWYWAGKQIKERDRG